VDPFPIDVSGAQGQDYNESGSGSETLGPCEQRGDPGCSTGLRLAGVHVGLVTFVFKGSTVKATADMPDFEGTSGTHLTCGFPESNILGDAEFPLSMVGAQTITVPLSRHDVYGSYTTDGSGTLTLRRVN
jgi:hypothetical protein